jgi:hypothetical protein
MDAKPFWEIDLIVFHVGGDDSAYEITNIIVFLLELLTNKQ